MGQIATSAHRFQDQRSVLDAGSKKVSGRAAQCMGRQFDTLAIGHGNRISDLFQQLRSTFEEQIDNVAQTVSSIFTGLRLHREDLRSS